MTPAVEHSVWVGVSFPGVLILAIAVGFLIYVFTGSSRLVAGVLFVGLLVLLAAGFMGGMRHGAVRPGRLVELAPQRQPAAEVGPAATTRLFDVPATGHTFVYVIDASASMGTGGPNSPLAALKEPLKQSITDLQRNHRFQVFVFDPDTSVRVPTGAKTENLAIADNHNVVQAMESIDGLTAAKGPKNPERSPPNNALYRALALQSDVIYFLTDGQGVTPSRSDLESIKRWNSSRTTLHVIQLTADPRAEKPKWLADLAREHRGQFKQAVITPRPAEKEETKQSPRPSVTIAENGPPKRPDWVTRPPQPLERKGNDAYRAVVSSGFSKGEDRCRENFDTHLLAVAAEYIDQIAESGAGQRITHAPGTRERALQYLSTNVIKQRYREERLEETPIDEGIEQFALLEFNEQAATFFRQEWRQVVQERRLFLFAGAVAVLLGLVGTIFGYLKTDTSTRGYYTGRLRLGAGVLIVGLIASAVALFMHG
jgi:hypothetical protein